MNHPSPDALTRRLASQVMYQIFPDRFAIGGGLSGSDKLSQPAYDVPCAIKGTWGTAPAAGSFGHQFFGGDLDGITDKLDYLSALGITGVYLTPVFSAPSNHKYDATDFFSIDAMFGGEPALMRLLTALHARGMTLTLDAVLNHISASHPWFIAAQNGDARMRDWFHFNADGSYQCWQDNTRMPELNLANPEVQDVLYRRQDSLVQHWLARGVDNWRFDVAQDVGMQVARDMSTCVSQRFPDAGLLGELNGFAGDWLNTDAPGGGAGGFHGMMNYWYRTAILSWLQGSIDGAQMNHAVRDARNGYGLQGLLRSWNMLSSHDTPRLRTVLKSAQQTRLAQCLQFTLPGIPLVYYGEETGMEGGVDPDCRRTMDWDESHWDAEQRAWVQQLVTLRRSHHCLQWGDVMVLGDRLTANAMVFLRYTATPGDAALVVVNAGSTPLRSRLLLPYSHWYDGVQLHDVLGTSKATSVQASAIDLEVGPGCAAVFVPHNPFTHYAFFKPRNAGL